MELRRKEHCIARTKPFALVVELRLLVRETTESLKLGMGLLDLQEHSSCLYVKSVAKERNRSYHIGLWRI